MLSLTWGTLYSIVERAKKQIRFKQDASVEILRIFHQLVRRIRKWWLVWQAGRRRWLTMVWWYFRKGRFDVSDNVVQYMLQNDINVRKGWARQFDLYQDFLPMINSVGGSLDKLLSSVFIQHCDRELIELLGKLKLNRFLKTLKDAEKDKFCSDGTYGDFPKYYPEFAGIYENLKQYAIGYNIRYLSPLTVKESQMYFKGISVEDYRDKGILHIYIDSTDEQKKRLSKLANEIFENLEA